jgi:hypothetical protein
MTEHKTILERDLERVSRPAGFTFDDLGRRRDRKRRNQRIRAGVVGIAVFVAAAVLLGSVGLSDSTQGPAGGGETGPTVTGPAETGPAAADAVWDGFGLPPDGLVPSTPVEGELVARYFALQGPGFAFVYADGRVISAGGVGNRGREGIYERRLAPEGVELVRSGAVKAERFQMSSNPLPADAWEDPEGRLYVPARYAACFESYSDLRVVDPDPDGLVDRLPPAAREILQGKERTYDQEETPDGPANAQFTPARCFEVTTAEALAVAESLSEAGLEPEGPNREVWAMGLHPNGSGEQIMLIFTQLLPHGLWISGAG